MTDDGTASGISEETNDWHPLPGLIGDAIVGNSQRAACGRYHVENDDGDIIVYRVVDRATSAAELETTDHPIWEGDGSAESLRQIAVIPRPNDGWDTENNELAAEIWNGYE